jgi:hypothetical protein
MTPIACPLLRQRARFQRAGRPHTVTLLVRTGPPSISITSGEIHGRRDILSNRPVNRQRVCGDFRYYVISVPTCRDLLFSIIADLSLCIYSVQHVQSKSWNRNDESPESSHILALIPLNS